MIPPWFSEENQVDPPSFWCGGIIVLAALTWSRRTESHQSLPEIAELKITDNSGSTPATPPGFSCPIAPVRADGVTQRARRATGDEFADGSLKALRRPQSALRQMSPLPPKNPVSYQEPPRLFLAGSPHDTGAVRWPAASARGRPSRPFPFSPSRAGGGGTAAGPPICFSSSVCSRGRWVSARSARCVIFRL